MKSTLLQRKPMVGALTMWIVDSSVWIDYFNGKVTPKTEALDRALGQTGAYRPQNDFEPFERHLGLQCVKA